MKHIILPILEKYKGTRVSLEFIASEISGAILKELHAPESIPKSNINSQG